MEGFAETVSALGGDPTALLAAVGLPPELGDPEDWVSYSAFLNLLELAAQQTGCPHFGLELSRHQGPNMLGVVGFVIQQAPDVGTALAELARHFAYHNQGAEVTVETREDTALLGFRVKDTAAVDSRQQYDLSIGVGINIMRLLCGPQWTPRGVYFMHSEPSDPRVYRELLRCPLHFNWEANMMTLDSSVLRLPISQANPHLRRILEGHLKQQFPNDRSAQVSHLIRQAMMTGDCSIERVAGYLSVNKRTLQRQLKSAGTSYKELLEDIRFDIARRYLLDSNGSLTNLADMPCYAELSAFSNAFKQRFGHSPREWKKAMSQRGKAASA
jgi:AraC-like DNA-binding protein